MQICERHRFRVLNFPNSSSYGTSTFPLESEIPNNNFEKKICVLEKWPMISHVYGFGEEESITQPRRSERFVSKSQCVKYIARELALLSMC